MQKYTISLIKNDRPLDEREPAKAFLERLITINIVRRLTMKCISECIPQDIRGLRIDIGPFHEVKEYGQDSFFGELRATRVELELPHVADATIGYSVGIYEIMWWFGLLEALKVSEFEPEEEGF
mmetsp:Transcript_15758/g.34107  ORF Transcript_15758/g.34107 Transcript_15758/m.34107 type:complete len:124 (-) Transcript_15758:288-659(-)|eukprot:CAMPEP_0172306604 /NCGR_PEP_ID=MMETSP1058-20130122/7653_1 /TAXON_ID=83371 /ORGANISM="Detonula confervacea, Strain CCMP 353" /LENGTH=123 /DNA_ID=CAMNT_0013018553 /DNA_START=93 /DNA_END=464 /DNA_ORIENTATION=+